MRMLRRIGLPGVVFSSALEKPNVVSNLKFGGDMEDFDVVIRERLNADETSRSAEFCS